jgi:hypothetical protein
MQIMNNMRLYHDDVQPYRSSQAAANDISAAENPIVGAP